jgi:hypothetical protein
LLVAGLVNADQRSWMIFHRVGKGMMDTPWYKSGIPRFGPEYFLSHLDQKLS